MNCTYDMEYMRRAMELAENGKGFVNPNPLVGAVIVKDGRVIGEGWHKKYGCLHAEREALAACSEDPSGSTMYVTLEPCCHYGKQPPCTEAIIAAGISRVVAGLPDPNTLVAGKGFDMLREHGIKVECGLLEADLKYQNRVFLKYMTSRRPWVTMKWAMTLDGKIAAATGDSRWVSSEESRLHAHQLRAWNMAIMAGIGTVRADDPMLDCRIDGMCSPVRVIADSDASVSLSSRIVRTARQHRTILAYTGTPDPARLAALSDAGVVTLRCAATARPVRSESGNEQEKACQSRICQDKSGLRKVDMADLMTRLGEIGIDSVLVEGGAELGWSMVESGLVDEIYCYIAPKVIGGSTAKGPVGGTGLAMMADAFPLEIESVSSSGPDILVHAFPAYSQRSPLSFRTRLSSQA